ncbi:hypothetical protein QFC22_003205 [Naganishia vaughanmartiniae]|uniref:Uncharacterized protein n=1 Tax=Naganishia vaughanmartiniae TaxID=1424756 RepID=A0ACC2X6F8_9TREE|nr:hypothetical protein QFC22_003205 [Naganishia vaughanmartiniae]
MSAQLSAPTQGPPQTSYASRIIIGLEEAGLNMDTPNSSNPASDTEPYQERILLDDNGEEVELQYEEPYEPSPFQQVQGRQQQHHYQQQQVTGQKDPRGSYMKKEGKNAVPVIDGDVLTRWDFEIGDVLADSAATSSVILPGSPLSAAPVASASLPPPPTLEAQPSLQPQSQAAPPGPQQASTEPLHPAK